MGMYASAEVQVGSRHFDSIAEILNLPKLTYNEEEYFGYLTLAQVKLWLDFGKKKLDSYTIETYGLEYKYSGVVGINDESDFQLGLTVIQSYAVITHIMEAHARNYISTKSIECKIQDNGRKNALRKISKKYKFIFG
jgi:hypothetical protein